jgi:hypothetical protein|tara:strand:- start:21 stop:167 length:147 start_codon:yes stop_codon:yes gene_type:complete
MKHKQIKAYLKQTDNADLLADFTLLVLWGVLIGSLMGFSMMLLNALIG